MCLTQWHRYYSLSCMTDVRNLERIAFPCNVWRHECTMEEESIQCDGCECWLHQRCIITTSQYVNFSQPHLQFFIRFVLQVKAVSLSASLTRTANYVVCVHSRQANKLTSFFGVSLPEISTVTDAGTQTVCWFAKNNSPWPLEQFVPAIWV